MKQKLLTVLKTHALTIVTLVLIPLLLLGTTLALDGVARRRTQQAHVQLMQTLLPSEQPFVRLDYTEPDGIIRSVHRSEAGYVIETVTQGYAAPITMYIAVNYDGAVMGLVVHEAHETPGLGGRILSDHVFLSQFLNQSGAFFTIGEVTTDAASGATAGSTPSDATSVDGISGATVSSKAVALCVNTAIAYVTGADVDSSATQ